MSTAINVDKLKKCVEKSGILLEHRSYALLREYVNHDASNQLRGDGTVGLVLFRTGGLPTEIDVFFDMRQVLPTVQVGISADTDHIELADDVTVRTLFVAECKGHPSAGFILVQKLPRTNDYIQRIFYRGTQESWQDGTLDKREVYMVNGGNFFKCNHKGTGSDQAVVSYEMDREGSRNKFFHAYEQIMCNIRAIIDNLDDFKNTHDITQIIRVAPLLITNAPIVAMRVEQSKATFELVPWVTYDARFQHFGQAEGKKEDLFDAFHVVSFDFLNQFVCLLNTPKTSLFPKPDLRHDIAEIAIPKS